MSAVRECPGILFSFSYIDGFLLILSHAGLMLFFAVFQFPCPSIQEVEAGPNLLISFSYMLGFLYYVFCVRLLLFFLLLYHIFDKIHPLLSFSFFLFSF